MVDFCVNFANDRALKISNAKIGKMKKVFIIDDNEDFRLLCSHALTAAGYGAVLYTNAGVALDDIKKNMERPDAVAIDFYMPEMNGDEFIRQMKMDENASRIPVILLSGIDNLAKVARQSQADGFLKKPFRLQGFIDLINRTVGHREATPSEFACLDHAPD